MPVGKRYNETNDLRFRTSTNKKAYVLQDSHLMIHTRAMVFKGVDGYDVFLPAVASAGVAQSIVTHNLYKIHTTDPGE